MLTGFEQAVAICAGGQRLLDVLAKTAGAPHFVVQPRPDLFEAPAFVNAAHGSGRGDRQSVDVDARDLEQVATLAEELPRDRRLL